jgi:hypothetical protein
VYFKPRAGRYIGISCQLRHFQSVESERLIYNRRELGAGNMTVRAEITPAVAANYAV